MYALDLIGTSRAVIAGSLGLNLACNPVHLEDREKAREHQQQ